MLFEKFSRFDEALHNHTEGTGLGMSITSKILSLMGSKLAVKSKYGKGSAFRFTVKQGITNSSPLGDFKERIKTATDKYDYTNLFTAPKAKVLVVDDNSMNRKVFRSLLKDTEIQIREASSGEECLKFVCEEHYDMIFLDHMMPDMDGIETLKAMKALDGSQCEHTPVFILTANAIVGAKEKYLEEGFDGYLSKPIIPENLEKALICTLPSELINKGSERPKTHISVSQTVEIEGIDESYASLHFSDREVQMSAYREFYKGSRPLAEKLNRIFKNLQEPGQIEEYRTCVHGVKGTASTIGAMAVYGMAKALEDIAKAKDETALRALHPTFMKTWALFTKNLGKALGYKTQPKKVADKEIILGLLEKINNSLESTDIDAIDAAVEELSKYRYSKQEAELLNRLKAAANDINTEEIEKIISEFRGVLQ